MLFAIMGLGVALLCLCAAYGICHQLRHRLWSDLRETWWFYLGTLFVLFFFLSMA